ncbi:Nn.00g016030.m01.CDS01 [Neocucurbitaria sp. VM-36]
MQARRPSWSSPPPSSPPLAAQRLSEAQSPAESRGIASPTWTAPSPTRTLGHSSPELPTLSSFSILGNDPRTPSTVARNDKTDTSYYTASWGSPYRHPPPIFNQPRQVSTNFGSDDFDEESSALQFGLEHLLPSRLEIGEESPNRFNLEHLIPRLEQNASPNQFTLEHLIRSRLPNLETPAREFQQSGTTPRAGDLQPTSEEWVRQFLEDRWDRETNDWRSTSSETDEGSTKDQDLVLDPPPKRGHKARSANKTLNQQDFWRHFSKDQKRAISKMMASKYADPEAVSHSRQASGTGPSAPQIANERNGQTEKLPLSPQRSTNSEVSRPVDKTPSKQAESLAVKPVQEPQNRPAVDSPSRSYLSPPEPVPAQTPRVRKKVVVKGKGCVIFIPRDIPRGNPGYPPKPMSAEAVDAKLQQLERQGYDTRGFSTGGLQSHNRAIWPEEADMRAERANAGARFPVRVAKKAEWDDYVNSLLEAKLAALGVSQGGEEDIPLPLSRQASSQQHPGQMFSPPLPTSSAGSHRMARQGSIVSGSFPLGPSPGHMSRQSIASPAAFANPRGSMHMHRHSTFASPANFAQHAFSPSGTWSPGGYFGSQDGRSGSPALPLSRPDLSGLVSPHSPFGVRPNQQFPITPAQKDDFMAQMQMQQQQLQAQLLHQQQQQLLGMRPSSTLAEVPEDEDEEDELPAMKHAAKTATEIAVPTPRGHRHNISENLEREAANEEYHLEEAIDKQFAEGGDFSTEPENNRQFKPTGSTANSTWEEARPVLHQPQPHSRAHSLAKSQQPASFGFPTQQNPRADSDGARTNLSENTNPSLEDGEARDTAENSAQHSKAPSQVSNSWRDNKFAFSKPGSAVHSKHTSRSSISKLNVEAKEFKFNPAASFSPGSFSSGFAFSPALQSPADAVAPRSNKPSIDGVTSFNVSAPAFKPDAPTFKPDAPAFKPGVSAPALKAAVDAPEFKPSGKTSFASKSSGFSFSSPPSFKPDAPVFNPGVSAFDPNKPTPAPTSFSSKIFGNVNISASDIVKPATRSKAVPIVRPDSSRQKTPEVEEEREDEAGRPMQADGREKRARRGRADGDDVPKFALQPILASQPTAEPKQSQDDNQDPQFEQENVSEDKENLSPGGKRAKSNSKSPEPLSLQRDVPVRESIVSVPEAESTKDLPADDLSDIPTPTIEDPAPSVKKHTHKSTLSASAKPFEFRPQNDSAGYDFGFHVTKPSQVEDPQKSQASPPRFTSRSPASTFRPSDDGSYKTALDSRRHAHYPESESVDFDVLGDASFNDIDAVMKHMNEEGSDFGVERDENSWEQSSPQRTPHEFERSDLQPSLKLRSDAPSPSPRRYYAPRHMQGSATSVQDPFDDERAAYESPVHRLNNADEVPMSDWDEGLLTEGEDKIQTRSRFFDTHVDDLMGRLLENRLGPLEQNLQGIQEALATLSQRPGRGRRSMSTNERLDSDADDEDDDIGTDSHYRNRSPRKDRRLEKIRAIVRDALESHQSHVTALPVPVSEPVLPEKIREIVTDVLAVHQATIDHVPADQIRAIVEDAITSNKSSAPEPSVEAIKPEDIRSILAEILASHAPQPVEPVKTDDIRSIVMEAFATHAPQPGPPPVPEQIWPDDLKAIVSEALDSHQKQIPTPEILQPETIRSIVAEALASQQPPAPVAPAVEPVNPDLIRSIVAEALASHKPAALDAPVDIPQPQVDMSEVYQVIGSLKASIAQTTNHHLRAEDIRELVDDAFKRQSMEVAKREEAQAIQERDIRIADLEEMLKEATLRFDAEAGARQALEAREADSARLLKVTEEELSLLQQAASDDESKIRALMEERDVTRRSLEAYQNTNDEVRNRLSSLDAENEELKLKNVALESSEEDLKKKLDIIAAENEALTFTLEEHRLSANKWRTDIQTAHEETEQLRKAVEQARFQAEEATRVRESMRSKFERLQQDMIVASQQVAAERTQWQKNEESSLTKYEILSARIEAEGRTRERLERELERLETQEREGMKLRIHLEQTQKHNARLEETIDQLRKESQEHQKNAERYERDMREAREAAHVEIRRTRVLMEADLDAANNQVNIVRHDLESEIARVRAELDQVRLDADTAKEKHELDLEAASDVKKQALQEALEHKRHSLQDQQRNFERQLEHIKQEHARALDFAREDRERAEAFHNDKLALSDSKIDHLKDKITLLEEKLQVAKEAASAAAAAASKSPASSSSFAPSGHEKISPQALRESIAVLQEQLQEREGRIESLERQLEEVDTEAPNKLKERDTEINWLRELLGVRIDDLNDLINSLAQPTFDRETVRDAAIRIRTNLQMEQSEKERLISGGQQSFPTLSTLSNFASPKAVQLAAAFGNWRKGRGEAASALAGGSGNSSRDQTPSRAAPHSAQSFLSGLMTPPTSNLRRTPDLPSSSSRPQPLRTNSNSSRASTEAGFPSLGKQMQPVATPRTPPLMRKASYDQDAEVERFSESGFYDDESTVDGGEMTPLALNFGRELPR